MTAEQSIRGRAAEVLREHLFRTGGSQDAYLGVCSCEIADHRGAPYSHDDWRAHLADALAAAGLLAGECAHGGRIVGIDSGDEIPVMLSPGYIPPWRP